MRKLSPLDRMLGRSAAMMRLRDMTAKIAGSDIPALIQGPTGAGKELVAEALHTLSGRPGKFVPVNVCAHAEGMFEDAVFGHVRGAFTGAAVARAGYLKEANGGTIFLDEIDGLSLRSQAALLRALEDGRFRAVGADGLSRSQFRMVAATNTDLGKLVAEGEFRDDLYHRIGAIIIDVPPLRERIDDLPLLASHFLADHDAQWSFSAEAMAGLGTHSWPGNIRELRNVVKAAVALSEGPVVGRGVIEKLIRSRPGNRIPDSHDCERRRLEEVLEECEGDTRLVAETFGVNRVTIYRWIKRLGIPLPTRSGQYRRGGSQRVAFASRSRKRVQRERKSQIDREG